ncbi:MAG: hypothetical protein PHQ95_04825 [Candidatus Gracilibacteria bacterium]|nr:hypothetical protein [Candidatus Gracilibacteria bacterium]
MDAIKILWRLQKPIFKWNTYPLGESGKTVLHIASLDDIRGNSYILNEIIEITDIFSSANLAQVHKIKSGLDYYAQGRMKKEYPTDYYQLVEKTENDKTFRGLKCTFPSAVKPIYLQELDILGMIMDWNQALKARDTSCLSDADNILSITRSSNDDMSKIKDSEIQRFGQLHDYICRVYTDNDSKKLYEKYIFSTGNAQKLLQKYQIIGKK